MATVGAKDLSNKLWATTGATAVATAVATAE
jgi:hypothetical protein